MTETDINDLDIRAIIAGTSAREDAAEASDETQEKIPPETGEAGATLPTSKSSEVQGVESDDAPEGDVETIEPPNSWSSQDKEVFRSLPIEAQRIVQARESERDSFLSQRSFEMAAERRRTAEAEQQAVITQQRLASDLTQLTELAAMVLPAQFRDIQTQADYLRVKAEDPDRASQFDAFNGVIQQLQQQGEIAKQHQLQRHLDNEAMLLAEKFPEFRDQHKGMEIVNGVRKGAVEHYGFNDQEVSVIADHRYVLILRDALAWKAHQKSLKSVEAARVAAAHKQALKPAAKSDNGAAEAKRILINQVDATLNASDRARARAIRHLM